MKIRVGFIINYNLDKWLGITYYYQNLFNTILDQKENDIEIVILTDNHFTNEESNKFNGIEIIRSNLFNRKLNRLKTYLKLFEVFLFGKNKKIENFLIKNKIDILSHTSILGKKSKIPSIKYIPDFQELYYPEYFNWKLIVKRKLMLWWAIKHSNKIILYSKSIKNDMDKVFHTSEEKVCYLPYCTNINNNIKLLTFDELKKKFNIDNDFFYLPNHFWKHKNHITVYKAIDFLKKKYNKNILLITTGEKNDYRNPTYNDNLENFIIDNKLNDNIKHLGIVSMNEVYSLIKYSKAVINPSYFEGWGTSVEHARYFNKHVIASNIDIHLEQNKFHNSQNINSEHSKKFCHYFNPKDSEELANLIFKISASDVNLEKDNLSLYNDNHKKIVREFYLNYLNIIKSII